MSDGESDDYSGLSRKASLFAQEYLTDLNATQAAIRAGYSKKTANEKGSQLLANPKISGIVAKELAERSKRLHVTADRVVEELKRIAFSNIKSVATWTSGSVSFVPSDLLSDDDSAAICEISESPGENGSTLKIKMYDKLRALELLGKHLPPKDGSQSAKVPKTITLNYKLDDEGEE